MRSTTKRLLRGAWRKFGYALLGACLFPPTLSHTATDSGNLNIGATITDACVIDSVSDVFFGTINADTAINYDTTSAIRWRCQLGTVAVVTLDEGTTTGDVLNRAMTGPGESTLTYQIYLTTPRTLIWGDRFSTAGQRGLTAYGRITDANLTGAAPSSYGDVVTLTLNF